MIGKTITAVKIGKLVGYDDEPYLRLEFTDGTHQDIKASYGDYTEQSADEYPELIFLGNADEDMADNWRKIPIEFEDLELKGD